MFDFIENLFRSFSLFLDQIVYSLVSLLYGLFYNISNIAVISDTTMNVFSERIYILLGVFMIFKITVSLISWYANPDTISDSNKGSGNLIKRVVISLVAFAMVPWIFSFAFRIQGVILRENIIGNIIMGGSSMRDSSADINELNQNAGEMLAVRVFQGFFYPENYNDSQKSAYDQAMNQEKWSVASEFAGENLNSKVDGEYVYHYQAFVSTIAGIAVAWVLLIFCIDIAIRAVKLSFLQLIAPIPVISYIDQKKGEKIFQNWVSECVKTYLDVFIRLIVIYFAVFLIGEIVKSGIGQYDAEGNAVFGGDGIDFFTLSFIYIGILMFANQLPKLISEILGIKFDGGFTLNPLKKLGASPLATGVVAGGIGAIGGFAANALAVGNKIKNQNLNDGFKGFKGARKVVSNLGGTIAGGISAGVRAGYSGFTSGGKGTALNSASSGIKGSNQARYNRDVFAGNPNVEGSSYGWFQRRKDDIDKFAGVKNKDAGVGKYDAEMKSLQRQMDNYAGQEQALRESLANYIADSKFTHSDFNENSLYKNGIKQLNSNGQYEYNDWLEYVANDGKLDKETFEKYKSIQQGIDHYDVEYEKTRRQYKQYEDAFKTRENAKKDK